MKRKFSHVKRFVFRLMQSSICRKTSSSYTIIPLGLRPHQKMFNAFGFARNAVSKIIRCVSKSISTQSAPKNIQLPFTKEGVQYSAGCFPQCIVVIDDNHVGTVKPCENLADCINRKRSYLINC